TLEEAPGRLAPPGFRPIARKTFFGLSDKPGLRERVAIPFLAQAHGLEALRPGDMGDALAAERGEMRHRERRSALVVRKQAQGVGAFDPRVDIDDRQSARDRLDRLALVRGGRGGGAAV